MHEKDLETLEKQIDQLIARCAQYELENNTLRTKQATWMTERAKLIEKNELAKTRVEEMIRRLKQLKESQSFAS